jgi:hypothetical protein
MPMKELIIQYDLAKVRTMMQLGEFKDERELLNFCINLGKWYLTQKSEGWSILAQKGEEVKSVEIKGI